MESSGVEELGLASGWWIASRRRLMPDDPFFSAGNIERELLAKQVALDLTEDERYQLQKMEVANTEVFPTSRLLSIHISEAHDSFFQAKVARGFPMYECLVEGCGVKLKSYKSRQQHLVDKHKFPATFEFYKKAHPSKHQRQKHQRRQGSYPKDASNHTDMDLDRKSLKQIYHKYRPKKASLKEGKETEMEVEERMDDLVSAVSKLSTTDSSPSSISFGHRHARGFAFIPRSINKNGKQTSQSEAKG
ncbi:hypothetical protein B296_00011328 [Ensete ventricosum]|uniref:C2H2-type domain-containing protein n=1 Tax=Ensete ventricosum TaxID=4639 RepID=A0A427A178_ENSVE|nr:hypothetical protein B296_00011328 [Ensete ventricosum]